MNRVRVKMLLACACIMLLAGCGQAKVPDVVKVTSVAIASNGEVTSYLVESFDKEYYNVTDLTTMAMEEASEYNKEHKDGDSIPIAVEKVELLTEDSGKVVLTHKFNNADSYARYNEAILFYGTVSQAKEAGLDLNAVYTSVKDGTLLSKEQLEQQGDKMILVTDAKAVFYLPGKVTHISGGVYNEDGTVDTTNAEGTVIVLLK